MAASTLYRAAKKTKKPKPSVATVNRQLVNPPAPAFSMGAGIGVNPGAGGQITPVAPGSPFDRIAPQPVKPPPFDFGPTAGQAGAGANPGVGGGITPDPTRGGTLPDWRLDAAYLDAVAAADRDLGTAESEGGRRRRDALLELGDVDLARAAGESDEGLLASIANNPISTLKRLARQLEQQQTGTTENFNRQNLFYSGHRLKALGDLGYENQVSQQQARSGTRGVLDQITDFLLGARGRRNDTVAGAANAASGRAIEEAIASGYFAPPPAQEPGIAAAVGPGPPGPVAAAPAVLPDESREQRDGRYVYGSGAPKPKKKPKQLGITALK